MRLQQRRGRLNRFSFTPDQVLKSRASCKENGSTWPGRRSASPFIESMISDATPCSFQRSPEEPCRVARFQDSLMVVTPNNGPNMARVSYLWPFKRLPKSPTS